jgi:hypothetical protein
MVQVLCLGDYRTSIAYGGETNPGSSQLSQIQMNPSVHQECSLYGLKPSLEIEQRLGALRGEGEKIWQESRLFRLRI